MKNDTTTTLLNFILAALVIMGAFFAVMGINRQRELNHLLPDLQGRTQMAQMKMPQVQMLLKDTSDYNTKTPSADLTRIIQAAARPATPAGAAPAK